MKAVGSFEQALRALGHLPESGDTRMLALEIRLALGSPLRAWESMGGASP